MNLNSFQSCRLVEGSRWYIVYYQTNPYSGEYKRHRETHNLNRIKSKKARRNRAKELMNEINAKLAGGYPYNLDSESQTLNLRLTPVCEAIQIALKLKLATFQRENSGKNYKSRINILLGWIKSKGFDVLKIGEFHSIYAQQFFNYLLLERKVSSVTYNSYLIHVREIFKILKKQFYIAQNPFEYIETLTERPTKIRKDFKEDARKAFISIVKKENDTWFLLSLILQYYFFIRPGEIRQLKVGDLNLTDWTIELRGEINKNWKGRIMKIPEVAKPYFPKKLKEINQNWFLVGKKIEPSAMILGRDSLYKRHRKYLEQLEKKGFDIKGLTLYSWKNTGGFDMLNTNEKVTVFDIQERMGHADVKTTKRYIASNDRVVEHINNAL